MRMADSILSALRSGSFVLAISSSWSRVMEPTMSVTPLAAPLPMPAAFLMRTAAGGVLRTKVKDLSCGGCEGG